MKDVARPGRLGRVPPRAARRGRRHPGRSRGRRASAGVACPAGRRAGGARAPLPRAGEPLRDARGVRRADPAVSDGQPPPALLRLGARRGYAAGMLAELLAGGMNANAGGASTRRSTSSARSIALVRRALRLPAARAACCSPAPRWPTCSPSSPRARRLSASRARGGHRGAPGSSATPGAARTPRSPRRWASPAWARTRCGSSRSTPRSRRFRRAARAHRAPIAPRGARPFLVVGTAGSVDTGAVDDLGALADLRRGGLWFHVDGAFGALAMLSPRCAALVPGSSAPTRSPSTSTSGCTRPTTPAASCCATAPRTAPPSPPRRAIWPRRARPGRRPPWFADYGPTLARVPRPQGLVHLREHGIERLGASIAQNVRRPRPLGATVARRDDLELLAPVPLNVVCFRFAAPGLGRSALDRLNDAIAITVQEAAPASSARRTSAEGARCGCVS